MVPAYCTASAATEVDVDLFQTTYNANFDDVFPTLSRQNLCRKTSITLVYTRGDTPAIGFL